MLMDGPSVQPFAGHVEKLYLDGIRDVVVDLGEVRWFGASMMGVLTATLGRMKERGGDVRLARISHRIDSVLMVSCLGNLFRTFTSVDGALESYFEEPVVTDAVTRSNRVTSLRWNHHLPQYVLDNNQEMAYA